MTRQLESVGRRAGLAWVWAGGLALAACSSQGARALDGGAGAKGGAGAGASGQGGAAGVVGGGAAEEGPADGGAAGASMAGNGGGASPDAAGGVGGRAGAGGGAAGTGSGGAASGGNGGAAALTAPCGWLGPGEGRQLAFSRDGATLVVAGGPYLKLLDAKTGKHVALSGWHDYTLTTVDVSRDGKWMAAGSNDAQWRGGVSVWRADDPTKGRILAGAATMPGLDDYVPSVAFSHDGTLLAASTTKDVLVFRMSDLSLVERLDAGASGVVWFSLDDKTLRLDGATVEWDTATFSEHPSNLTANIFREGAPARRGFSDDESVSAVVVDVIPYEIAMNLPAGAGGIVTPDGAAFTCAAVSRTGKTVAGGDEKGRVVATRAVASGLGEVYPAPAALARQPAAIVSVAVSPDDAIVAAASKDGTLAAWKISDGSLLWHADGMGRVGQDPNPAVVLGVADAQIAATFQGRDYRLSTTVDGVLASAAGVDDSEGTCVTDVGATAIACPTGAVTYVVPGGPPVVLTAADASSGRRPLALAADGVTIADEVFELSPLRTSVVLWNATTKTRRPLVDVPGDYGPEAFGFSRDGKTLAAAINAGVRMWDVASGAETARFGGAEADRRVLSNQLVLSGDGKTVAECSRNGVRFVDVASGAARTSARPPGWSPDACLALAISRDGTRILAGADDAGVYRVADGALVATIPGYTPGAGFRADGTIARGELDGSISLWCAP